MSGITPTVALGTASRITALAYAGGTLLAAGPDDFLIWRQDPAGWDPVEAPQGVPRLAAALTPDGAGVYVSEGSAVLTAPIRKHLRRLTPFFDAPTPVRQLAWSPGGETLLVLCDTQLAAVDWTGRARWTAEPAAWVAWAPDGLRFLAASGAARGAASGAARWCDGASGASLEPAPTLVHPLPRAIAFSPRGGSLAQATGAELVVSRPDGTDARTWRGAFATIDQLAWLDERTLAVAGTGGPAVQLVDTLDA